MGTTPEPKIMCLRSLRNIDHATIRVFLRLLNSSGRTQYTWDAQICDDAAAPAPDLLILSLPEQGVLAPPAVQAPVIVLKHPHQTAPQWPHQAVTRPLQLEEFTDVLLEIESLLAVSPHRPAFSQHPTVDYHDTRLQYKLAAWPSSHILMKNSQFSRLAAFLRSRFLGLEELIRLSRCDDSTAVLFLSTLHDLHLLQVQRQDTPVPASPSTLATPAVRVLGIIERLRRKMGLGGMP
jgi:hypothetical protein